MQPRNSLRIPDGKARLDVPVLRPRKCKLPTCGRRFTPRRQMQPYCGPACEAEAAPAIAERIAAKRGREARKAAKLERQADNAKREAMKTIPKLKKEAEKAFHAFVRARDRAAGYACICCGGPLQWDVPGGAVDAAHFRSRGAVDHLRYHEDNAHAARSDCNQFGHLDYRGGLIARIGLARVEALESDNRVVKWTHDGLREIRDRYRRMAKELERV